jgi:hypothetical protein
MMAHPTVHARGVADFVDAVVQGAFRNTLVHSALIALVAALLCGYWGLSSRLGMRSLVVRGGLIAYLLGALALIAAGVINGLVLPELAARFQGRPPEQLEVLRPGLALCHAVNQVCSRVGTFALSVAVVLWSVALTRRPGAARAVGVFGYLAGALPLLALLGGHLRMDVHGMLAFLLAQTAWGLAVAALLLRERL